MQHRPHQNHRLETVSNELLGGLKLVLRRQPHPQKESKQSARKDPVFKTKERESKQSLRGNPVFKAKEIAYQNKSKERVTGNHTFKAQEKVCQNKLKKGQGKIHMFWNVRE